MQLQNRRLSLFCSAILITIIGLISLASTSYARDAGDLTVKGALSIGAENIGQIYSNGSEAVIKDAGGATKTFAQLISASGSAMTTDLPVELNQIPESSLTQFQKAMRAGTVKIAFWGDSTMQSADNVNDTSENFSKNVIAELKRLYPALTINYTNFAVGGATLTQAASASFTEGVAPFTNGLYSWATPDGLAWKQYLKSYNPDLLVVGFGTNINTTADYVQALADIKSELATWTTTPSVVCMTPFIPNPTFMPYPKTSLALAEALRNWARNEGYGILDQTRQQILQWSRYGYDEVVHSAYKYDSTTGAYGALDLTVNGWSLYGGGTISGKTFTGDGSASYGLVNQNIDVADFILSFDATFDGTVAPSILFRSGDASWGGEYQLQAFSNLLKLWYRDDNVYGELGSQSITALSNGTHNLKLSVIGDTFLVYIDNVLKWTIPANLGNKTFERGKVVALYQAATGKNYTLTSVNLTAYKRLQYVGKLTDTDIFGQYIASDYLTKLPNGGNGVNHISAIGLDKILLREARNLYSSIRTVAPVKVGVGDVDALGTPSAVTYLRGDGQWSTPSGGGGALTIQEVDGAPVGAPGVLKVSNGTLTDNGDGSFSLVNSGGATAHSGLTGLSYAASGHTGFADSSRYFVTSTYTKIGEAVSPNNTAANNTIVGKWAGWGSGASTGGGNTLLGDSSAFNLTTGYENTAAGLYSMYSATTAHWDTCIGKDSCKSTTTGNNNTAVGLMALNDNVTGNGNVALGFQAGYYETGSNKLHISNVATTTPLIYGDFSTGILKINGLLTYTGTRATVAAASTKSLTEAESGTTFYLSSGASVTMTLPADPVPGTNYSFCDVDNSNTNAITVTRGGIYNAIMKMPSGSTTSYVTSITNATTGGSHCATLTYAQITGDGRWLANHIEGTWN